ncbi:hypothetical protein BpHYR1_050263 [Brachionus plicatilis]|uniref:Uncharacterized protein n=1 Tax=Brachionus plicatilis TaxID=10195 RepID=A0A3M7RV89_BRAPC|nr:hypothetical protein BpHYR1_050263 [Brachionus plicatilis]
MALKYPCARHQNKLESDVAVSNITTVDSNASCWLISKDIQVTQSELQENNLIYCWFSQIF